jgi:hypothetical protein
MKQLALALIPSAPTIDVLAAVLRQSGVVNVRVSVPRAPGITLLLATVSMTPFNMPSASAQEMSNGAANFYTSDHVAVEKVTFKNSSA